MKIKIVAMLSALPLMALASTASAQTDLTCDDIEFAYAVTSVYPDVADACLDVVESNGERFAKTTVELLRTGNSSATFRFKHADGSTGPSHRVELPSDWRANIGGRQYRIRELSRGQELNVYLPSDRWEAHVDSPTATFVTYYGYTMYEADDTTMAALPSTASPLTTFGAMGGAALLTAFLMRIYRRRRS
mgnify:FL=1|jgi:hypothetical protein